MENPIVWVIGVLIIAVLAIQVIIPTAITAAGTVTTIGTATNELWAGTAATGHAMAYHPITGITSFDKAVTHADSNDTKLSGSGTRRVVISETPIRTGEAWNAYNVTITGQITGAHTETVVNTTALPNANGTRTVTLVHTPTTATVTPCTDGVASDIIQVAVNGDTLALWSTSAVPACSAAIPVPTQSVIGVNNISFINTGHEEIEVDNNDTDVPANGSTVWVPMTATPKAGKLANATITFEVEEQVISLETNSNTTGLVGNGSLFVTVVNTPVTSQYSYLVVSVTNVTSPIIVSMNGNYVGTISNNTTNGTWSRNQSIAEERFIVGANNISFQGDDGANVTEVRSETYYASTPLLPIATYINGVWFGNTSTDGSVTWTPNATTQLANPNNFTFTGGSGNSNITNVTLRFIYQAWGATNITNVTYASNAAADTVTWITGCGYANRSVSNGPNTWTGMNSSPSPCLPDGTSDYNFTFVTTALGNVTNITVTYFTYATSAAYTYDGASGVITPTATGYYRTTYSYGTSTTTSTNLLMLLLPLLIAVVVLLLFLKSSGLF